MLFNKLKTSVFPFLVIVLGFSVIFPLSAFIEKEKPDLPAGFADSDLALQGSKLKGYSFGFEGLIADFYWINALQYIGNKIIKSEQKVDINDLRSLNPRLLFPYLDNATTLDPKFIDAYAFGAIVLPAIDAQKAIKIAEKGIKNNPNEWRLYQHLGYIYWRLGDFEKSGEVYSKGAKIPSSPPFMKMIAFRMKMKGESRETAREIYTQMLKQSEDKQILDFAESRILYLKSLDEIDAVNSVLNELKKKNGNCIKKLPEILPELQKNPVSKNIEFRVVNSNDLADAGGIAYLFDSIECKIRLDTKNTKLPLK